MRNRLWVLFHMGTFAVLALLTIANVVTWLRPFASVDNGTSASSARTLNFAQTSRTNRSPASSSASAVEGSKNPLKVAQVGCDPTMRLRVLETVRQVRLQFDPCSAEVTGVLNSTNGFEATIFGTTSSRAAQAETERAMALEPAAGTFSAPQTNSAKPQKRQLASTEQKISKPERQMAPQISTDYISLATGTNQIKIMRAGSAQILSIERK